MIPKVKICGIRDTETALGAIEAGADFLGFNFSPTSKRRVTPEAALSILKKIESQYQTTSLVREVQFVALFFQNSKNEITRLLSEYKFHAIQYVADREKIVDHDFLDSFRVPLIPQIGVQRPITDDDLSPYKFDKLMILDSYHISNGGGLGRPFPWRFVKDIYRNFILAGGLSAENVISAIEEIKPYGVDVASGVESAPGQKDLKLIKKFIDNAKRPH